MGRLIVFGRERESVCVSIVVFFFGWVGGWGGNLLLQYVCVCVSDDETSSKFNKKVR